jgi:hypothetical protein
MALMDFDRSGVGRLSKAPSPASRTPLGKGQRSTWWRSALKVAGTLFVLMGIAIGILTLRLALVLSHGVLH